MLPTGASIVGAIFSLVLFVIALGGIALFAYAKSVTGVVSASFLAGMMAYVIIANDWPRIWKQFLIKN